ncbi:MAG: ANTAR domain-containing protein [Lachnospiraceae bacterium]|nr:ANTAR domain-containing protein [Lachnospiraceae bacterium]
MPKAEQFYSTLIVSSSPKFREFIKPLLTPVFCDPVAYAESSSAAQRLVLEKSFDLVIVNSPLRDDMGLKLAIDASRGKGTVCLFLSDALNYDSAREGLKPQGVFTLMKPVSASSLAQALEWLSSAREKLRSFEKKALTLEEKMAEIRTVNRAKLLLIENRGMTESEAHRYIEREAMDRCVRKGAVADEIIDLYVDR